MNSDNLNKYVELLLDFLEPVLIAVENSENADTLLRELGYSPPSQFLAFCDLSSSLDRLFEIIKSIDKLAEDEEDDEAEILIVLAELLANIKLLVSDIHHIEKKIIENYDNSDFTSETDILISIRKKLFDYLAIKYIQKSNPTLSVALSIFGIFNEEYVNDPVSKYNVPYVKRLINWDKFKDCINNPIDLLKSIYVREDKINYDSLLLLLNNLVGSMGVFSELIPPEILVMERINNNDKYMDENVYDYLDTLSFPLIDSSDSKFILELYPIISGISGDANGLGICFKISGDLEIPLTDYYELVLNVSANINNALGVTLNSIGEFGFINNIYSENASVLEKDAQLTTRTTIQPRIKENIDNIFELGSQAGSRIEIEQVRVALGIEKYQSVNLYLEGEVRNGFIVLRAENADGFISKILPADGITTVLNFIVGISNDTGFYFKGSSKLDIVLPLHSSIGPVVLHSLHLAVKYEGRLQILVASSFSANLGPLSISIQDIGLRSIIEIDKNNEGNYGPLNYKGVNLKFPTGAGLALNTSTIVGGGFLEYDDDNKRYAGILQLRFQKIGLVAIGLITTRMSDGSDGYSLLINIGVTFNPAITLPYNFTLSGVGGLFGYNRVMKLDVLRDGLRNKTLDSILFPEDAIKNAPKIISDLRSVFPPTNKRFVIGPMVKLGWGSQNIIQADIGIFIEMPAPVRVALLGQITVILPKPDEAVIELHIDVLGVLDIEKKELSIDATIYDSRIYKYTLSGDAALRWNWGNNPVFALSLGGFHPAFSPPKGFPALRRLKIDLSQSSRFQLYGTAYNALTSNTLQFGAGLTLYAKDKGASVEGSLSFDALFYFDPFTFTASISGNAVAKYKGRKLSCVRISLRLTGPRPWNARGSASFEILYWNVTVKFNKTWGSHKTISNPAVNPLPKLKEALNLPANWGSRMPDHNGMVEVLAKIEEVPPTTDNTDDTVTEDKPLLLHPGGFLEVRQNVLPLGIKLDTLGNAPVKDNHKIDVKSLTINDAELQAEEIDEDFARGQFVKLAESERLSAPSFEKMQAGVIAKSQGIKYEGAIEYASLEYESKLIQEDRTTRKQQYDKHALENWQLAQRRLRRNAANTQGMAVSGERRFATLNKSRRVIRKKVVFAVVENEHLAPVEDIENNGHVGWLQAEQLMAQYIKNHPDKQGKVMVVPSYEQVKEAV